MAKNQSGSLPGKVIGLALGLIVLAFVGIFSLNLLFASNNYSVVTNEQFTGLNGSAVALSGNHDNAIVADSYSLTFSNGTAIATTNYTVNLTAATVTIDSTFGDIPNNTAYYITYGYAEVDSTVTTLAKSVLAIVIAIGFIVMLLKASGIKIK